MSNEIIRPFFLLNLSNNGSNAVKDMMVENQLWPLGFPNYLGQYNPKLLISEFVQKGRGSSYILFNTPTKNTFKTMNIRRANELYLSFGIKNAKKVQKITTTGSLISVIALNINRANEV